jgi:hypothetical protein
VGMLNTQQARIPNSSPLTLMAKASSPHAEYHRRIHSQTCLDK